jgi:hypothetical protein
VLVYLLIKDSRAGVSWAGYHWGYRDTLCTLHYNNSLQTLDIFSTYVFHHFLQYSYVANGTASSSSIIWWRQIKEVSLIKLKDNYFFGGFFIFSYYIQHCFICRPSDSAVPTDAGIEPRTVATSALAVRRSNDQVKRWNFIQCIGHCCWKFDIDCTIVNCFFSLFIIATFQRTYTSISALWV